MDSVVFFNYGSMLLLNMKELLESARKILRRRTA